MDWQPRGSYFGSVLNNTTGIIGHNVQEVLLRPTSSMSTIMDPCKLFNVLHGPQNARSAQQSLHPPRVVVVSFLLFSKYPLGRSIPALLSHRPSKYHMRTKKLFGFPVFLPYFSSVYTQHVISPSCF